MGLFESIFGKKANSQSPQEKFEIASKIIDLAVSTIRNLEMRSNDTHNDQNRFEIFMFNLEFFTIFLLKNKKINDEKDFRFLLIHLLTTKDFGLANPFSEDEFLKYYSSKTAIISSEISRLSDSLQNPNNKMFISAYIYSGIYLNPLQQIPDISFADFSNLENFDGDLMGEAASFTSNLVKHLNDMATVINRIYPV